MKLQKYESGIVTCTKNYLIKLERIVNGCRRNEKKRMLKEKQNILQSSQRYAIHCTCELLKAHPHFNYMQDNVVNFIVPLLNSSDLKVRSIVQEALMHIFANDKRGEISYAAVKKINHHLRTKTHEKIRPEMLQVLLSLRLYILNEAAVQRQSEQDDNNNKNKKVRGN